MAGRLLTNVRPKCVVLGSAFLLFPHSRVEDQFSVSERKSAIHAMAALGMDNKFRISNNGARGKHRKVGQ
jgi:hypothetical protein